jgi:hypothetical protein
VVKAVVTTRSNSAIQRFERKASVLPTMPNPIATFTTSMGSFKAEIYLDRVPRTASSFIDLANSGFYNGLHFHRVIVRQRGRTAPHTRDTRTASAPRATRARPNPATTPLIPPPSHRSLVCAVAGIHEPVRL